MNLGQITQMIGEMLEVDEDRYPTASRRIHVNQAIDALAMENDFPFDQVHGTVDPTLTGNEFPLANGFSLNDVLIRVKSITGLDPVLSDELDSVLDIPTKFTHYGMMLYLNGPIEALDPPVYFTAKKKPDVLTRDDESNGWTAYLPYLVLYKACIYSSIWLVEEQRVSVFAGLVNEELTKASVEYDCDVVLVGQIEEM